MMHGRSVRMMRGCQAEGAEVKDILATVIVGSLLDI